MKSRLFLLALVAAACVHGIAGLLLSGYLGTFTRKPPDAPQVAVSLELAEPDSGDPKAETESGRTKREGRMPGTGPTAKGTVEKLAAVSGKPPGEATTPITGPIAEETGEQFAAVSERPFPEGSRESEKGTAETGTRTHSQASVPGDEPPYVIDTPPRFLEKGPISFPQDIQKLTASTSIVVYLSLSAKAEVLSLEAMAKGVDELKVEVIKMMLKSRFTPAYVGKRPVPCVAKCVVTIVCKQVD